MTLKSKDAVWFDEDIKSLLEVEDLNQLDPKQMIRLIKELDRRFIQLWDKVNFERVHNLVDYKKLKDI